MIRRADPLPWTDSVSSRSAALVALHNLVLDTDVSDDLAGGLTELERTLSEAVPSFVGLHLTMDLGGPPVVLATLEDAEVASVMTSLRWASVAGATSTTLTLYARQAGALVDLAADLSWTARQDRRDEVASLLAGSDVELDRDLPPAPLVSGLTGLAEFTVVNQAQGVLISRGTDPEDALTELIFQAQATGTELIDHARRLLAGPWAAPTETRASGDD